MLEFTQCGQVAFQTRLDPLAGTQHGYARRIEAGIGGVAPPHIPKPTDSFIEQIEPHQDLCESQENKQVVHSNGEYQTHLTHAASGFAGRIAEVNGSPARLAAHERRSVCRAEWIQPW